MDHLLVCINLMVLVVDVPAQIFPEVINRVVA
jgi:hypothetical protein